MIENWTYQRSARIPLGPLHYYAGPTHIPAIFILYAVLLQTNKGGHYHKVKKSKFKSVNTVNFDKKKKGMAIFGSNYCKELYLKVLSLNYSNACISILKWKLTITINIYRQTQTDDSGTKTKLFSKTNETNWYCKNCSWNTISTCDCHPLHTMNWTETHNKTAHKVRKNSGKQNWSLAD